MKPIITKQDFIFLAAANALVLIIAGLSIVFHWNWVGASLSVGIEAVLLAWFCFSHKEVLFARFFVFGAAAGFVELINDTYLIKKSILIYSQGGPFVVDTPLYMPFSWALIFVTNGAISVWLYQKFGLAKASILMGIISALYIPGFEALANWANWWHYQNVKMLFGLAPWFVILGEGLLALPLPFMNMKLVSRGYALAVALGCLEGLIIFATTLLALEVTG
jgi:hypothetical protein